MDPKSVSITSVSIINTLTIRTMYLKMMEIEIYHDFTHCTSLIPYNKINPKNHKQYIFQILGEK